MAKELINPKFDYKRVSKDEAKKLMYFEGQLTRSRQRVADELMKHGEILHGARETLSNHGNGVYRQWLEMVGVSHGSAQRAIDAYLNFNDCPNLGQLEVSAMYELANNTKAKKKALTWAEKGTKITLKIAKDLIASFKPKPEPEPEPDEPEEEGTQTTPESPRSVDPFDEANPPEESEPPRSGNGQPPKQYNRTDWFRRWENAIGPIVKLVDKIAEEVHEKHDPHHVAIQERLNEATVHMEEWLNED